MIAVHLCPRNTATWRNRLCLPSKACKLTAALAAKAYSAAGQAVTKSHSAVPREGDVHHMVVQECHLWLNLAEMRDVDKAHFLDTPISQAGLFGDTVEGFAQQFSAVQQQTEAIQHILPQHDAPSTAAPGARPQSARRPPEPLCPRLNRHLGRRVEPLAGERRPLHPSQAPSRPGSRRSGPDAGNPEMLEFALSQETARTGPGGESSVSFCFCSAHFLKERAISFSSGFSSPWDDSV